MPTRKIADLPADQICTDKANHLDTPDNPTRT